MPPKSTQQEVIEQLHQKNTPHGHIGNAMNVAQRLIHRLNKVTKKIEISGRLRHLDLKGHNDITVVCTTKAYRDLLGKLNREPEFSQVHQHIISNPKHYRDLVIDSDKYIFNFLTYKIILYHTWSVNEMAVAQILHSGPENFTSWFLHAQNGPIPFGYSVNGYTIRDNKGKPLTSTPQEKDVFNKLGYNYIYPSDRDDGNSEYWHTFKIAKEE